ncbi:hypothetical protein MesoLjLa_65930 (plasmid) [Mesorhizobium sp. L-2-11]|nr:hypothetical protein MesoLjLa_65930 [Mesorhizobium sp. L-2-11]
MPVQAPQENMLKHGANRLPGWAQFTSDPRCQLLSIFPLQTPKAEMPQNLRAMSAGGPTGEIIVVYSFRLEVELLGQIQNAIRGNRRVILHKGFCCKFLLN